MATHRWPAPPLLTSSWRVANVHASVSARCALHWGAQHAVTVHTYVLNTFTRNTHWWAAARPSLSGRLAGRIEFVRMTHARSSIMCRGTNSMMYVAACCSVGCVRSHSCLAWLSPPARPSGWGTLCALGCLVSRVWGCLSGRLAGRIEFAAGPGPGPADVGPVSNVL